MGTTKVRRFSVALATLALVAAVFAATGCGEGQPMLMSFTGKGSDSAKSMKLVVDKLKKKYKGKVVFIDVDMDDPASKGEIDKYHVTMNPTFIMLNTKGQVKETFMGAAQEEMLVRAIESYIPKESTSPGTSPTTPGYPSAPYQSTPGSTQTAPVSPVPQTPPGTVP